MTIKLGILMDPIKDINIKKDSSFAMLMAAQARGYELYYLEMKDLYLEHGQTYARVRSLTVQQDPNDWYQFSNEQEIKLSDLDVLLMRKDPPFDTEFIYATYLLERAEDYGLLVVNKPQSLRDCNEKLYTAWFSDLTPATLVTRRSDKIRQFYQQHQDMILSRLMAWAERQSLGSKLGILTLVLLSRR